MFKIMQIKVTKYALVLQKHPSKCSLEITTKILTMNNTKKAQNCQTKKGQIKSRIRWSIVEKVYGRTNIDFCPLCLAEKRTM